MNISVQELCEGSLNRLLREKKKTFTANEIYEIFTQLNKSFRILCENNLSHKDIRLEKILIKTNERGEKIYKLTELEFNRRVEEILGDSGFMAHEKNKAPEILNSVLTPQEISEEEYQKADLWSIGINIYLLYFGKFPYEGNNANEIMDKINKNPFARIDEIVEDDLKDLVRKLLRKEKDKRIDWKGYFEHKFFSREKKEKK